LTPQANDWSGNAVGLQFSHSYGFGLMDAGKLVSAAKQWKSVPEQANCTTATATPDPETAVIAGQAEAVFELSASSCSEAVGFLEHVQLHIDLDSRCLSYQKLQTLGYSNKNYL
jgi:hypothetical protein